MRSAVTWKKILKHIFGSLSTQNLEKMTETQLKNLKHISGNFFPRTNTYKNMAPQNGRNSSEHMCNICGTIYHANTIKNIADSQKM